MRSTLLSLALLTGASLALPQKQVPNGTFEQETRSLDEIYEAAVAEGGVVTLWHGGDEKTQQNFLKKAFETRFPKMTLNVTVDLSKYHDGNLDLQLAAKNVYVDSIILQTLHDYPRWKKEGVLLNYAPVNFDKVYSFPHLRILCSHTSSRRTFVRTLAHDARTHKAHIPRPCTLPRHPYWMGNRYSRRRKWAGSASGAQLCSCLKRRRTSSSPSPRAKRCASARRWGTFRLQ